MAKVTNPTSQQIQLTEAEKQRTVIWGLFLADKLIVAAFKERATADRAAQEYPGGYVSILTLYG